MSAQKYVVKLCLLTSYSSLFENSDVLASEVTLSATLNQFDLCRVPDEMPSV